MTEVGEGEESETKQWAAKAIAEEHMCVCACASCVRAADIRICRAKWNEGLSTSHAVTVVDS